MTPILVGAITSPVFMALGFSIGRSLRGKATRSSNMTLALCSAALVIMFVIQMIIVIA